MGLDAFTEKLTWVFFIQEAAETSYEKFAQGKFLLKPSWVFH